MPLTFDPREYDDGVEDHLDSMFTESADARIRFIQN
jgi:hypothetical protein